MNQTILTATKQAFVLEFSDVRVTTRDGKPGDKPILESINLQIEHGETLGIVGGSGSGKSTLLRLAAGVISPGLVLDGGFVSTVGMNLFEATTAERENIYGSAVALVAQSIGESLTPHLSIMSHFRDTIGREVTADLILESLNEVGLRGNKYLDRYPHELSGGERQRVLIALALFRSPQLLLLDEPTSALDVGIGSEILATIDGLQKKRGFAMVCVSHDLASVGQISRRIAVMNGGRIVESGKTPQVLHSPTTQYTTMLVNAIPKLKQPVRESTVVGSDPILVGRELTIIRGGTTLALDSLDFEVNKGEVVGVIGESGSGKSSLLAAICGLLPVRSGSLKNCDGYDLTTALQLRPRNIVSSIQMVFQNPDESLNPTRTVEQSLSRYTRASKDEICAALDSVGLGEEFLSRRPHAMSGGEKQRAAIARALLSRPQILLLDEVTSALDVTVQAAVLKTLAELQRSRNMAIIIVSHDIALVASFADSIIVLRNGKLVEQGSVKAVTQSPKSSYTQHLMALAERRSFL
jgi:peptide/nickel transport system ATP-binding protein